MSKIFIPLGNSCSIAYNLKLLKLRTCAFPFDWVRISNFNNVTKLIQNKFYGFLDSKNFKFKEFSDKFIVNGKKGSYIYSNDYCSFYHEFSKLIEKSDFNFFKEKYSRRIKRFFEFMNSSNEIIFIREEFGKVNMSKIDNFINTINEIYPDLNYKLIIITNQKLNFSHKNLKFYYSDVRVTDWKRPELDWIQIFNL